MTLLDFRKPKCVILRSSQSYSGKYKLFYGHHYVQGKLCYDVGAINNSNGEIITRHYSDSSFPNPKSEALMCYEEFKKKLTTKPEAEETDDNVFLTDEFRRQLNKGRGNA